MSQLPRPRRPRHRHHWAIIEHVMGFAVKRCTCGEKRFEKVAPVQARQMELFVM